MDGTKDEMSTRRKKLIEKQNCRKQTCQKQT